MQRELGEAFIHGFMHDLMFLEHILEEISWKVDVGRKLPLDLRGSWRID